MTLIRPFLWPFTLPYGAVARLRARAYKVGILRERSLDGVVISVGNLTVGGTGKTPMTLWIAERLLAEGKRVGILTRGYGGVGARASTSTEGGEPTSDEVELLKARLGNRVALGVGPDRYKSGRQLEKQGVRWFVLDDGFQHLALARDVNIVLIDATDPFGGGRLLPAGRLREPPAALGRADIVVITRSGHAPEVETVVRRYSGAPIFYARACLDCIRMMKSPHVSEEAPEARSQNLFAFCGIGNPAAFLADLETWGFRITGHKFFPDHHRYTTEDVRSIQSATAGANSQLAANGICTEKDTFNFGSVSWHPTDVFFCRISMRIDDEQEFWRMVRNIIERRGKANG